MPRMLGLGYHWHNRGQLVLTYHKLSLAPAYLARSLYIYIYFPSGIANSDSFKPMGPNWNFARVSKGTLQLAQYLELDARTIYISKETKNNGFYT